MVPSSSQFPAMRIRAAGCAFIAAASACSFCRLSLVSCAWSNSKWAMGPEEDPLQLGRVVGLAWSGASATGGAASATTGGAGGASAAC